jgi:hypothetical protein
VRPRLGDGVGHEIVGVRTVPGETESRSEQPGQGIGHGLREPFVIALAPGHRDLPLAGRTNGRYTSWTNDAEAW